MTTNTMVATKALACKMAKAAWHVMRTKGRYDGQRVFGGTPPEPTAPAAAPQADEKAAGQRKVSFPLGTEVEKGRKKQAGAKTSPIESFQLSDQTALRLHSCRAVSSAGKSEDRTGGSQRKHKKRQPM